MDLGERILRYYLKIYSIFLFIFIIIISIYSYIKINNKKFLFEDAIDIKKGDTINNVLYDNFSDLNLIDYFIFKLYYKLKVKYKSGNIHYGYFKFKNKVSFSSFLQTISKPANVLNKITIIEGWNQQELNKELKKYFTSFSTIQYDEIFADTYYFSQYQSFESFIESLKNYKNKYINNYLSNIFFENYNEKDLMIIGSLIEKEGLDYNDKKKISSVIMNRLKNNMKLQIDATVIFAITDGKYDLDRKLLISDLKFKHPYNTYIIQRLPPKPISYVGKKTVDIILENYKSDFLFYFYNNRLNRHIFSIDFNEHKKKLNEYRKNQ